MDTATMELLKHFHFANEVWVLILPCALMALDVITGLIKSWKLKSFESSKMRSGLAKKVGELAIIVIGELFSFAMGLPRQIMQFISLYITFMEFMSNLENCGELGAPLPKKLIQVLKAVEEDAKSGESENIKKAEEALKKLEKEIKND